MTFLPDGRLVGGYDSFDPIDLLVPFASTCKPLPQRCTASPIANGLSRSVSGAGPQTASHERELDTADVEPFACTRPIASPKGDTVDPLAALPHHHESHGLGDAEIGPSTT